MVIQDIAEHRYSHHDSSSEHLACVSRSWWALLFGHLFWLAYYSPCVSNASSSAAITTAITSSGQSTLSSSHSRQNFTPMIDPVGLNDISLTRGHARS